ncbi:MAG TPA: TetR/AcrR family transcriptional regulator [Rhizomicrobium sp.]|nr:TetR/AcrR family transcriptional regulator [Rhizomicrobium sp.]
MSSQEAASGDTRSRILEAALARVRESQGEGLTMSEVADQAGLSRQAVYLHFADRKALMIALTRYADEARYADRERGLAAKMASILGAPSARAAVAAMVAMQAGDNPGLWPVARLFDRLRRDDPAVDAAWQERLANRLAGCRAIAERFKAEGALAPHLSVETAADLLWTLTSQRMWEELVMGRGWTVERYRSHIIYLAVGALTH